MSCCGSCAHGRKCEGKKRRKNPNFLYLANGRRGRRRRNPASNTWIYQANGRRSMRRRNPWTATTGWSPASKPGYEERVHEFTGGENKYVGAELTRKVGSIGPVRLTLWKSAYDKKGRVVGHFKSIFPALTALATKYSPKQKVARVTKRGRRKKRRS